MRTYYPVWIAAGGQNVIRRGPDCATPNEAAAVIKDKLAKGYASLGMVIMDGEVMGNNIYPPSARKLIAHYEAILNYLER